MEERPHLSFVRKFLYSGGTAGYSILEMLVVTYLAYYTLPPKGAHLPQLIPDKLFGLFPMLGIIMLFGRIVDSITDPLFATWSDRAKFKMGRRMPFILGSTLPFVLSAVFLFHPISRSQTAWNSLYLIVMLSVYFVAYTAYVVPYSGLLPEISRTDRERLNLTTMQGVFGVLGIAFCLIVFPLIAAKIRYTSVVGLFGLVAGIFLIMPVFGIDERKHCVARPTSLRMYDALKAALGNKAFTVYLLGYLSFRMGFMMIIIAIPYYVTVLLRDDQGAQALYFGTAFLTCMVGFVIANVFGKRYGKKAVLLGAMIFAVLFMPGLAFLGMIDWSRIDPGFLVKGYEPVDLYTILIMGVLGIPMAALYVIPNAIVADLTDVEKKRSGQNLEAVYYGVQGFFTKFMMGLSFLFVTGLFAFFGRGSVVDSQASDLGIRLTGPLAAAFIFAGYMFTRNYPEEDILSERKPEDGSKGRKLSKNR